jgi:hypothetical protein
MCGTIAAFGQQAASIPASNLAASPVSQSSSELPDSPDVLIAQQSSSSSEAQAAAQSDRPAHQASTPPPQPKRILGLMPNYRAVSAGVKPPPATPKQAFTIATRQSFDYSAFVFVGVTSLIAEGEDSHPKLGKGVPGFWAYSWRGYVDKTDGNYWVVFILPSILHEDERYYALGRGSILHRALYSVSRVAVTPTYSGHPTVNGAELIGRGVAQAIGTTYYPSSDRTASALASKYGYALLRDASTNAFREFWPDIAVHVFHRNP